MPVTILLKAIGMTPEEILSTFHDFENFTLAGEGARLQLVPERLRGEMAKFDVVDASGKVIVGKDKRITAKHIRELATAGVDMVVVTGRFPARPRVRHQCGQSDGELLARANEEITEDVLDKLRDAGVTDFKTLYLNDLDRGSAHCPRPCVSTKPLINGLRGWQFTA
jgi:DNA-directed RNA polymerase subunit beta